MAEDVKPGGSTSEFRLTVVAMVVGVILEGVSAVLLNLQARGVDKPWFAVALTACGVLLQIVSLLGYQRSRSTVKAAALYAEAGPPQIVASPTVVRPMVPQVP